MAILGGKIMKKQLLSVVVPVFNEEEVITKTNKRLNAALSTIDMDYEIIYVNDGSRDKTALIVSELCSKDTRLKFLNFSRNFGHQIAITAGMDYAKGDAIVVIDADLQDPPELIVDMVKEWRDGYDVVYAKRISR